MRSSSFSSSYLAVLQHGRDWRHLPSLLCGTGPRWPRLYCLVLHKVAPRIDSPEIPPHRSLMLSLLPHSCTSFERLIPSDCRMMPAVNTFSFPAFTDLASYVLVCSRQGRTNVWGASWSWLRVTRDCLGVESDAHLFVVSPRCWSVNLIRHDSALLHIVAQGCISSEDVWSGSQPHAVSRLALSSRGSRAYLRRSGALTKPRREKGRLAEEGTGVDPVSRFCPFRSAVSIFHNYLDLDLFVCDTFLFCSICLPLPSLPLSLALTRTSGCFFPQAVLLFLSLTDTTHLCCECS